MLAGVVLAGAVAWADSSPAPEADARRLNQLQRNHALVRALVNGGLQLAGEEDPLVRADYCHRLAERMAAEVRQAAGDSEASRAAELSGHLSRLLRNGVAVNLFSLQSEIRQGSAREKDVRQLRKSVADLVQQLEKQLKLAGKADPTDLARALEDIGDGHSAVEQAVHACIGY
jgi:hypothetical protein